MTRPRRSTRITGLHSYHGAVRPCAARRYSGPRGFCRLDGSLSRPAAGHYLRHWPAAVSRRRFPGSAPEPKPSSRHLQAGHHLGSQQAPPRLIPGMPNQPGFDVISQRFDPSSVVYSRSPSRLAPDALTARLFPQRSARTALTAAPCGGLRPPPTGRPRRTTGPNDRPPHLRYSTASVDPIFYIESPSTFLVALRRRCWSARRPRRSRTSTVRARS